MKLKRKHYETAIAVMDVLSSKLWVKEKCRIVIDYDPAEEMVTSEAKGSPGVALGPP